MTGSRIRRCNSNGTWTGTQTRCNVIRCPQLFAPTNGSLQPCSNLSGQTCQFSCGRGYNLTGSRIRRCNSNGTWTGTQTQCNEIPTAFINNIGKQNTFNKDNNSSKKKNSNSSLAISVSLGLLAAILICVSLCVRKYRAGGTQNLAADHNVAEFRNGAYLSEQPTSPDSPSGGSVDCVHFSSSLGRDDEPVTEGHCLSVSPHVGVYWMDVLRNLSMNEMMIRNLDEDYKHCKVVEKCYQGLLTWKESVGPQKATLKTLCDALRQVGCSEALKTLSKEDVSNTTRL
ncbi:hypothetical protein ACROYT_G033854 [Oculina patagonica]